MRRPPLTNRTLHGLFLVALAAEGELQMTADDDHDAEERENRKDSWRAIRYIERLIEWDRRRQATRREGGDE